MIRMLTKRGLRASDLVCSPDVADTIINDAAVQKLLDNRRIEIGNVEPELLPDGAAIVARLNVLGRIISVISYDLTYTDDEGNDQALHPVRQVRPHRSRRWPHRLRAPSLRSSRATASSTPTPAAACRSM